MANTLALREGIVDHKDCGPGIGFWQQHKKRTGRTRIVKVPLRRPFIEEQQHLTAAFRHRWPSTGADRPGAKQAIAKASLQYPVEGPRRRSSCWVKAAVDRLISALKYDQQR